MRPRSLATNTRILALVAGLLVLPACNNSSNDNGDVLNPPGTSTAFLQYDGPHDSSPVLPVNLTYEAAARFTPTQTALLTGGKLTQIQFYIQDAPDVCRVKVYAAGTPTAPGALLYSADVTPNGGSWNYHNLASDVTIPVGDLWIAIEFEDGSSQTTIGCDPGPGVADGRWIYNSGGSGSWTEFGTPIDWNIRGIVETTN